MYSLDRRQIAYHIYYKLQSYRKTASLLQVSHSTVFRWLNTIPKVIENIKIPNKSEMIMDIVKTTINTDPFIIVEQLCVLIKDNLKINVSKELVRIIIKRLGITRKKAKFYNKSKNLYELVNKFINKRNHYIQEGRTFISIDETSFGKNGIQIYGYNKKGERLLIQKKISYSKTMTVVTAITNNELLYKEKHTGSCNALIFLDFLKSLNLPKHSVIVMDNARIHHAKIIKQYCDDEEYEILFSPPYSPWFNPIELCFSIIKRHYYKYNNVEEAFLSLKTHHIESFFKKSINCEGYF